MKEDGGEEKKKSFLGLEYHPTRITKEKKSLYTSSFLSMRIM